MWEKVTWVHPLKRKFVTRVGLTGQILRQEISGTQTREVIARGATQNEYAALVEEQSVSDFVDGLDFSAAPTFRHGYERFDVSLSGTKLIPAESTDGRDGSYTYDPANAALT